MAVQTFIDGVEQTSIVDGGTSTHRLNKKWTATCRIPTADAVDGIGKLLKVVDTDLDRDIDFHGYIKNTSAEQNEDGELFIEYSAEDIREIWEWRPARDPDGDLSLPTFLEDNMTGPQIVEAILDASESAGAGPNTDAEGPLFIDWAASTFAGGGADLSGAPVDWPMSIEEIVSLLVSTGELDVLLLPIDTGGNLTEVHCFNGDYGDDLTGSVQFVWEPGGNVKLVRRLEDMSKTCNKLYYYLGPKCDEQHWRRNVQNDDPGLPDPFPNGMSQAAFTAIRDANRIAHGVRMDQRIYDDAGAGNCDSGSAYPVPLFWRLWETESLLRVGPRTLYYVTPVEGLKPVGWDVGDIVHVESDGTYFPAFSGGQRVYERTIAWDADGVVELSELGTSADQEA
jgi:hypothetical protein